jgi:hypothetical protein
MSRTWVWIPSTAHLSADPVPNTPYLRADPCHSSFIEDFRYFSFVQVSRMAGRVVSCTTQENLPVTDQEAAAAVAAVQEMLGQGQVGRSVNGPFN